MGTLFRHWQTRSQQHPQNPKEIVELIKKHRNFETIHQLKFGDHGLQRALESLTQALKEGKRLALYADYDVDGTMSCVSWVWFLEAMGYKNYVFYIPDRMQEGYGVHLSAVKHLVEVEKVHVIVTMDTGITANQEAAWCKERGVVFICTDHHKIQPEKIPDSIIVNPKLHPDPLYQELCGCGMTFVLLRQLGKTFQVPETLWMDLLALAGMATICDVVPLNGVNHRLAGQGVQALFRSQRPVLKELLRTSLIDSRYGDEKDVGFRLGPRINAVGRLAHAKSIIQGFTHGDLEPLLEHMTQCNEKRKNLQKEIVSEALDKASIYAQDPILFMGSSSWHQGVVGIAASKLAEQCWKPTWLFSHQNDGLAKGSARTIPGFDIMEAMGKTSVDWKKFGGHTAAAGYTFLLEKEDFLRKSLCDYALTLRETSPYLWESHLNYDCQLPLNFINSSLLDDLQDLRPFGHGFEEPLFRISGEILSQDYFYDKQTKKPKHTAFYIKDSSHSPPKKVLFFQKVIPQLSRNRADFLVNLSSSVWKGAREVCLSARDWEESPS